MKQLSCIVFFLIALTACSSSDDTENRFQPGQPTTVDPETPSDPGTNPNLSGTIKYLALGDSYTIGQNVCESCRFPAQLKSKLENHFNATVELEIIATTGWTTTNLINAVSNAAPTGDRDLVTLLIGVNNQYQHKPFSLYESEFPQLVNTAINLAGGEKANVIVVSIPDYAYTPFGSATPANMALITAEIAQYNAFASNYCQQQGIVFINITDITQNGLTNPALVASDGLHPSQEAYAQFVERILPTAIQTLP